MNERRTQSVWWLVAVMVASAAVLFVVQVQSLAPRTTHPSIPWWLFVVGFAAAEVFVVLLRLRRGAHSISLSEIPLVLGLAFTAPVGLIAARVLGGALALVIHRRQRGAKLAFNVAHFALEGCLGIVVYRAILGSADPGNPRGWLAAFGAMLLLDVLGALTITAAISLSQGGYERGMLVETTIDGAGAATANTSLALVAVLVLERDLRAVWLLIVVAAVLHIAYRAYTGLSESHARMELLYGFTSEVGRSVQPESVQRSILTEARDALRAGSASLLLFDGDGVPGPMLRLSSDDVITTLAEEDTGPHGQQWWSPAAGGDAVAIARNDRDARSLLGPLGVKDAMAAPLSTDAGVRGVLLVEDRVDDISSFTAEDLRLLETLANHARVSLDNSALVDQLRTKAAEQEHDARHDHLTGLPNRRWFTEAVDEALRSSGDRPVAVMLIDLDRFKEINDTLGHHVGDELLREVGRRLQVSLVGRGEIARLGGDEFAARVTDAHDDADALDVARGLLSVLDKPVVLGDLEIDVRASVGVAVSPHHGDQSSVLLQRADVAMYVAKAGHSEVALYDPQRDPYSPRRLALAAELRRAVESGGLSVFYQPKMSVASGEVIGAEALVRWYHPRHGLLAPDEFIPLAESTGLIRPLTRHVLETSLRQCAAWRASGLDLGVAVNMSARNLLDEDLPATVAGLLAESGLESRHLTLEITEDSIMVDPPRSLALLGRLHASGIRLSIDDFGTGYSSLSYLKQLPVDEVKIDKSFVMTMEGDGSDATIVRSTIDLGHNLGLKVVAEGVETRTALHQLEASGCDVAQGYYFSRPVPAPDFERWLRSFDWSPSSPTADGDAPRWSASEPLHVPGVA